MRRVLNGFCVTTIDLFAFYFADFNNNNKFIGSFCIDTLTIASYNVTQNNMIEMKMMRHRTNEKKEKQTKGTKLILKILTQEYMNMKSLRKSQYHSGFKRDTLLCRHFFFVYFFFYNCTCIDCRYQFFFIY